MSLICPERHTHLVVEMDFKVLKLYFLYICRIIYTKTTWHLTQILFKKIIISTKCIQRCQMYLYYHPQWSQPELNLGNGYNNVQNIILKFFWNSACSPADLPGIVEIPWNFHTNLSIPIINHLSALLLKIFNY